MKIKIRVSDRGSNSLIGLAEGSVSLCDLSKTVLYVKRTLHGRQCSHLFAHGARVQFAARSVAIFLQRELVLCRLAVHRVVEVHRCNITVHVMSVHNHCDLKRVVIINFTLDF